MSQLPREVVAFAKQMGLNLQGLELEAGEIWKKLNEMSEKDPAEYQRFVQEQSEGMKEMMSTEGKGKDASEKEEGRMFRPIARLSLQTNTIGGDGLKVREIKDTKDSVTGKDMYINICCHDALSCAKDSHGNEVKNNFAMVSGLELPLLIGPLRNYDANTVAVDVVYHPTIVDYSINDKQFQKQMIDLALEWIEQERNIKFSKDFKISKKKYNCGLGDDQTGPVLCPVDPDNSKQNPKNENNLQSPTNLLSTILKERDTTTMPQLSELNIGTGQNQKKKPPSASTTASTSIDIFNIIPAANSSNNGTNSSSNDVNTTITSAKTKKPIIKKGFLQSEKNAGKLYPDGSTEGSGGASGGSLARIMDKCKVVNMAATNNNTDVSSEPKPIVPVVPSSKPVTLPSQRELENINKLTATVDQEWGGSGGFTSPEDIFSSIPDDEFTAQLESVAKILCPDSDASVSTSKEAIKSNITINVEGLIVSSTLPTHLTVRIDEIPSDTNKSVSIAINNMDDNYNATLLDLIVSENSVQFTLPNDKTQLILKHFPMKLNHVNGTAAKYSKKHKKLMISINYTL